MLTLLKKNSKVLYIIFIILYLEFITKLVILHTLNGLLYTFLFSIPLIIIINLITSLFKEKINSLILFILSSLLSIYYGFQGIFYRLFNNIFSFNTLTLATDIGEFKNLIFDIILKNIPYILIYLIPIVILIITFKKMKFTKITRKSLLVSILISILIYIFTILSFNINNHKIYSAYNLYYNINSEIKIVEKFGLATYTRLDFKRIIFDFNETLNKEPDSNNEEEQNEEITYNEISINFEELINNEDNETIKNILEYFKISEPTNKNEYTGMFKDKNLIFILAEGFNSIAVNESLTPTLYKLTHEGFVFNNFYSPVFLSTTGGEFQATTGLIPTQETLSLWKKKKPNMLTYGQFLKTMKKV